MVVIEQLNMMNGFAGTMIDRLVDHLSQEQAWGSDFAAAKNVRQDSKNLKRRNVIKQLENTLQLATTALVQLR